MLPGFLQLPQTCKKSVKIRRVETWDFTDLLQLVETTCSKPVDNKFTESTCNKSVDNLQQTCRQQVVERILILGYQDAFTWLATPC